MAEGLSYLGNVGINTWMIWSGNVNNPADAGHTSPVNDWHLAGLLATLLNEMERTGARYGLQTMCEGGGQANATIIERLG